MDVLSFRQHVVSDLHQEINLLTAPVVPPNVKFIRNNENQKQCDCLDNLAERDLSTQLNSRPFAEAKANHYPER